MTSHESRREAQLLYPENQKSCNDFAPGAKLIHAASHTAIPAPENPATDSATLAPPDSQRGAAAFFGRIPDRAFELRGRRVIKSRDVELLGLFHARKLRVHELALACGWDRIHKALRITKPFYDRFTPAIAATDFELRPGPDLDRALDFIAVCR